VRDKGRGVIHRLCLPGRVALSRRRWTRPDGSGVVPVDPLLDRADRAVSLGVTRLACRLALDAHSFARAAANLEAAAQLSLSAETLRKLVEAEGKLVVEAQTHEQLELDWHARDCVPTPRDVTAGPGGEAESGGGGWGEPVSRVYLSCDGVHVPLVTAAEKCGRREKTAARRRSAGRRTRPLPPRKPGADPHFKEFKIVTLYDQGRERRVVRATRRDHRHAGRLVRRLAAAARLREAQEKVAVVDGAPWIEAQLRRNAPYLDAVTLDFYHLSQHVHQTRAEVFGEEDAAGRAWAGGLLHAVKHGGYAPLWDALVELRARTRSPARRRAVDVLMHYAAARREMIGYERHEARGWDIGSGPMESMCKATTRRLKGRGMRWDADNAEAIMALECLVQGQEWDHWWSKRHRLLN